MSRLALATSFLACALLASTHVAGAVLPQTERPDPAFVDMRMAVAASPTGSTRWTEITVPAATPAMWLVPVRPGAAVDWAPRRWLDALDEATGLRVLPPTYASTCPWRSTVERVEPWTAPRPAEPGPALSVQTDADAARSYVAARGYRLSHALAGRISELYAGGWNLVALEIPASSSAVSSGTLRVSDDGGAVLPLAISGSSSTRVTAFAIGAGAATVPGARDVDRQAIRWGQDGSNFVAWRRALVEGAGGAAWLRESSSHAAIFDGTPLTGGHAVASAVARYFHGTSCAPSTAASVGSQRGVVGTSCAPGAAARIPGGAACVPASADVDPAALSCTSDIDLALALSGLAPASATLTRMVGWIPAGGLGANLSVEIDPAGKLAPPVVRAWGYEACSPAPSVDVPGTPRPPLSSGGGAAAAGGESYVTTSDGCGGGAIATGGGTYEEEPVPEDDSAPSESCSGGSSSGWGGDDDDGDDSSESCSSDSSSSSSSSGGSDDGWDGSDSDDGWDSSDSDDGWDSDDGMSPRSKKLGPASKKAKPHARTTKKKSSPVSRYALLAVALLLPLRRRRRGAEVE